MPSYNFTHVLNDAADTIKHANIATQVNITNIINRAARSVLSELDLRSTKRKATAIQLFDDVYDYTAPTDLKGFAVIDIIPQKERKLDTRLVFVKPEEFDRKKSLKGNLVTVADADFTRKIRFSGDPTDTQLVISNLDTTTDPNGTWVLFGDGTNLTSDTDNYVVGGGSINWDISSAGGTTAGIQNTTLTAFDITKFTANGSAFVWAFITSTTNITNFKVRIGMDTSSNYYELTTTTQADGSAFQNGWNLLKFNFNGVSETGTVTEASCDSVAIYMTKDGAKVSETDYRFDYLVLHTGEYAQVLYYSKFLWQASGTYKENATASSDSINVDTDEYQIIVERTKQEIHRELREFDDMKIAEDRYEKLKGQYKLMNPSERVKKEEQYY